MEEAVNVRTTNGSSGVLCWLRLKQCSLATLCLFLGLLSTVLAILLVFTLVTQSKDSKCLSDTLRCYKKCNIKQDCQELNWRSKEIPSLLLLESFHF